MPPTEIHIRGARQHNLKDVHVTLPRDRLVVITGVSGSGKSSLAFDTLYAEGQRRYVESLSTYARQFVGQLDRPDVDAIEGLSPAIAIDQRTLARNPRSTVGTATEVYDFLRLLFARLGTPHCPLCGMEIRATPIHGMKESLLRLAHGTSLWIYAPLVRGERGSHRRVLQQLARQGFIRARVDGRLMEIPEIGPLDRTIPHRIEALVDRLEIRAGIMGRLAESLEAAARLTDGLVLVETPEGRQHWFSERPFCVSCGVRAPAPDPKLFSFNDPRGACAACKGLGFHLAVDPDLVVPDPRRSLAQGAVAPWARGGLPHLPAVLEGLGRDPGTDMNLPFRDLPPGVREALLWGAHTGGGSGPPGRGPRARGPKEGGWEGVIPWLERHYQGAEDPLVRRAVEGYMSPQPCPECGGARLGPEARGVRVGGFSLPELCRLPIARLIALLDTLALGSGAGPLAAGILREIRQRLQFLEQLGLTYLTLDRSSETLSGGEAQRIRLATQLGSSLAGVLYVLDEPSIGLHCQDQVRLLETLRRMTDAGSSVVVVEHDAQTIWSADFVVDMGPGAGEAGGRVLYAGPPGGLAGCEASLTGAYLSGRRKIPVPRPRRKGCGVDLVLRGASEHNLKGIDVRFPLGCLTCVTGVSGSGKSSLVVDTLYRMAVAALHGGRRRAGKVLAVEGLEQLDRVVDVDQAPIGRTPRSNPATYTGVFRHIREIFSQLPESRARGYGAGRYSFNIKGGRCEACRGDGVRCVEMLFLPDVYATCEVCHGTRYNEETLEVRFKGLHIAQILDLTVAGALPLLENLPRVRGVLQTLQDVGLGYLRLGQAATTLSGGEAQRLKLARELSRPQDKRTLFILDEPTTGLHLEDIRRLLEVLQRLLDAGNTVVVIEHNLEVIKCADHVIDLGPGGGDAGGHVVACGTPEEVAAAEGSVTGRFLRELLPGP
jgi:excinuclease ABC subunit A